MQCTVGVQTEKFMISGGCSLQWQGHHWPTPNYIDGRHSTLDAGSYLQATAPAGASRTIRSRPPGGARPSFYPHLYFARGAFSISDLSDETHTRIKFSALFHLFIEEISSLPLCSTSFAT
jgi:hypothetical protein